MAPMLDPADATALFAVPELKLPPARDLTGPVVKQADQASDEKCGQAS